MSLEVNHLSSHQTGFKHGNSGLLEGMAGTAVEVATAGANTSRLLVTLMLTRGNSTTYALMYSVQILLA